MKHFLLHWIVRPIVSLFVGQTALQALHLCDLYPDTYLAVRIASMFKQPSTDWTLLIQVMLSLGLGAVALVVYEYAMRRWYRPIAIDSGRARVTGQITMGPKPKPRENTPATTIAINRKTFLVVVGIALFSGIVIIWTLVLVWPRPELDWKLTTEQRLFLGEELARQEQKYVVQIWPVEGTRHSVTMARSLFDVFRTMNWPVSVSIPTPYVDINQVGIAIAQEGGVPRVLPRAEAFQKLFERAGIKTKITGDTRLKGDEVGIVVGQKP